MSAVILGSYMKPVFSVSFTGHLPVIHRSYTGHPPVIHRSYTGHTPVIHRSYTGHTPVIHRSYTGHTPVIHRPYTGHTPVIHRSYTGHTLVIHRSSRFSWPLNYKLNAKRPFQVHMKSLETNQSSLSHNDSKQITSPSRVSITSRYAVCNILKVC